MSGFAIGFVRGFLGAAVGVEPVRRRARRKWRRPQPPAPAPVPPAAAVITTPVRPFVRVPTPDWRARISAEALGEAVNGNVLFASEDARRRAELDDLLARDPEAA